MRWLQLGAEVFWVMRKMSNGRKGKRGMGRAAGTLVLVMVMLFSACAPDGELREETDERAYRRGKSLLREGRQDEALAAFLSVIDARPDAAESHLEAGLLYLDHLEDPLAAIYHFRQYVGLRPETEQAGFVKELIETAKKDFVRDLPGEPLGEATAVDEVMEKAKRLQVENEGLKERLGDRRREAEQLREQLGEAREVIARLREEATGEPQEVAPIIIASGGGGSGESGDGNDEDAEVPARYTVKMGDTLSRISREVYGTSGRWAEIFEANRDQLPSPNALRPGQVLEIPR